jgi:ketosteroid isomerase-like protein
MTDPRQVLTIWEENPDGALRVKLLAWNKLVDTRALDRRNPHQAFTAIGGEGAFEVEGDFSSVLAAEEKFHQACGERRVDDMAGYYADGAMLIPPGSLPLQGKPDIARYFRTLSPGQFATKIDRDVARVEGNADYVLVVNLFRWTFIHPETNVPIPIVGKGVHLWQRGENGDWQILFDLPNASQGTS